MKSLINKIFSLFICILLVACTCITSFAKEEKTEFVSEPGSILVAINKKGEGETTGSGFFQKGDTVTLTAIPDGVHDFEGWYDRDKNLLSTELTLTLTAEENCIITAKFESKTEEEKEAEKQAELNKYEARRQAIWIASIIAVSAVVVFLVVVVEKKRSKE